MHFGQDRPERRAAWDARRTITFAELDALAGTLAASVLAHFAPDDAGRTPTLPIIVGYQVESVIAIHAAVRAGLTHAPIESNAPAAVLADLWPRLGNPPAAIITRPEQAALLPNGIIALLVPSEPGPMTGPRPVEGAGPAVVIFTSGSTGRPKGVVLTWDCLPSRNFDLLLDPDEADPAPAALMTPISYPFGHWRALVPGLGSPVSVIDPMSLDPAGFLERVDRDRIRVLLTVPSFANSLAARWPVGRRCEHVRELHVFGEPLDWSHVPALRTVIRDDAVITFRYGSTEAFEALRYVIPSDQPLDSGTVPLGSPMPGFDVWLDPLDPADPDSAREIVISQPHLSLGYLDEPELNAIKFGQRPDGSRYWRSGDIATIRPDGLFVRTGRVDDMVKIRGKLVEPSQPQQVLCRVPGIRNAVVLPQPGADGTPRLVAHVELEEGSTLTATEVRRQAAEVLAPHLVPHVLVRHERLPLNDVGKIDRRSLLAEQPVPWRAAPPRPAADEFERFAMSAAGTVLGGHDIDPDDDLWELGLDSLSAVELTVLLEEAGWTRLEPAMLMEHRSPAALARLRKDQAEPSEIVWLNRNGTRPPILCIPGGGGTAMAYRWVAAGLGADQPLMVVEQRGLHSPGRPDRTVEQAAARALALTGAHLTVDPVVIIGYSGGGVVAYETAARLEQQGRSVHVLLIDSPGGRTGDGAVPVGGSMVIAQGPTQAAKRAALRAWLRVFPASTVPREQRYRALFLMSGRAMLKYAPPPAGFPVTLFHTPGSPMVAQWRGVADRLETVEVTGNHYTMLEPPHASGLVRSLQETLAS